MTANSLSEIYQLVDQADRPNLCFQVIFALMDLRKEGCIKVSRKELLDRIDMYKKSTSLESNISKVISSLEKIGLVGKRYFDYGGKELFIDSYQAGSSRVYYFATAKLVKSFVGIV